MSFSEEELYKLQIQDRACTICARVEGPQRVCDECGEDHANWVLDEDEKEGASPETNNDQG